MAPWSLMPSSTACQPWAGGTSRYCFSPCFVLALMSMVRSWSPRWWSRSGAAAPGLLRHDPLPDALPSKDALAGRSPGLEGLPGVGEVSLDQVIDPPLHV